MRLRDYRIYWVVLLGACLAANGISQVTTADIVGTVTDASGAAITTATISIENLATEASRAAKVDSGGAFGFPLLPTGTYSVKVEAPGFKLFAIPALTLSAGDRARVDAHMQVGGVNESVTVEEQAPALQTDSAAVGSVVTRNDVENLPTNGRNFVSLAQLSPGANAGSPNAITSGNRPDDRRPNAVISVNAFDSNMNNFMVDGIDNNDRVIGTVIIRPSLDALSEFRVDTSLYTAEVSRTAGGVVNVLSRSGSNALHGSLFEFFRNDKMDARDFFALRKPEYRLNQFGGSAGGPIRKNKTFFFGDIEETRQLKGNTYTATVPSDNIKRGNFAGVANIYDPTTTVCTTATNCTRTAFPNNAIPTSRQSQIALNYLALYPTANLPALVNNYVVSPPSSQFLTTTDFRIDHRFSEHNTLFGRYSLNNANTFVPGAFPEVNGALPGGAGGFPGPADQRAQNIVLSFVHIVRSDLLVDLKGGFTRYASGTQALNFGRNVSQKFGLMGVNEAGTTGLTPLVAANYTSLGDSNSVPIQNYDNTFQYQASVIWSHGALSLKTGAVLIRRQFTNVQTGTPIGQLNFDANATNNAAGSGGNSLASFLLGFPATASRTNALMVPGYRIWEPGGFVQADWRATSWLTLNLGARYDVFSPVREVANRLVDFNIDTAKLMVAGVNGVSNTAGVATDYSNFAPRAGFAATVAPGTVIRGGYGISFLPENSLSQNFMLKNAPFLSSWSVVNDTLNPTYNISQGIPLPAAQSPDNPSGSIAGTRTNFRSTMVQGYNLTAQKDFFHGNVVSIGYVAALGRHVNLIQDYNAPPPGAGAIGPRRPYGLLLPNITSIGLHNSEASSNYHSLQATFNRRFRSGLILNSNYAFAHSIDDAAQAVQGHRNLDRANSSLDVRHRWTLTTSYELPIGKSLQGLTKKLLAGWQVNGIVVWQTGLPFSVSNATALANTGGGDRPNRIADGSLDNPTIAKWFDTSAFVAQAANTFGNSGRNILYGPRQRRLDLSFFKRIPFGETRRLEFRAEAFNVTNTPSFGNPNGARGNAAFGTIAATVGTPRQIQLALKLVF